MSLIGWIGAYSVQMLFWVWVVCWGGAERLEGTLASFFLVSWFAPEWSSEGIKLFGWLMLIGSTIWFLVGIFLPEARFIW